MKIQTETGQVKLAHIPIQQVWGLSAHLWNEHNENQVDPFFSKPEFALMANEHQTLAKALTKELSERVGEMDGRTRAEYFKLMTLVETGGKQTHDALILQNVVLVGLYGEIESGKSWASNEMAQKYFESCRDARVMSFAAPIKQKCQPFLDEIGFTTDNYNCQEFKSMKIANIDMTVRELYQQVGEKGRKMNSNLWLDMLALDVEIIRTLSPNTTNYIFIDDVRYHNERDWIKSNGGLIIKMVDRDQMPRTEKEIDAMHESEKDWREWEPDGMIINDKRLTIDTEQVRGIIDNNLSQWRGETK